MTNSRWSSAIFKLLLVVTLPMNVWAYRVLMVPVLGKSHVSSMAAIAEGLANRGHEVTLFIGEGFQLNLPEFRNRTAISVVRFKDDTDYDGLMKHLSKMAIELGGSIQQLSTVVRKISQEMCDRVTADDNSLNKLHETKFDVAVVDAIFFAKCLYLIAHRLQIPYITYTDAIDPLLVRVPWLPSFVPCGISPFSEKMSFFERLRNTIYLFSFTFVLPMLIPEPSREVMDKFRRYGHFDSLDELASKSVLWLSPKDDVLDYAKPMMPNMVNIGGLTVKRTTGELPSDIKSFIDGARKGVLLMTFGSVASVIPSHMVEKFSSAFRRLGDYRVIWRLDNEDNVELPDNVMVAQWLPQNDILSHPSVKLFITHSGNNGQYEAIYHGVPMIGMPLTGDQIYNAKRLDHKGYGLSMNLYDFTADELLDNIHKILGDKSYKERVMKASEIFRSQAQSPVERAVFWIEHVCQFGGDHLRSAGNDLPLYSYLMLDVLAFVLIILHILIYLLYRLFKFVINKCRGPIKSDDCVKKNE